MIDIGKLGVSKIYIGKTEISKVYVGSVQVYPSGSPTPIPTDEGVMLYVSIPSDNYEFNLWHMMEGDSSSSTYTGGEVPQYNFEVDWNDGSKKETYTNSNWKEAIHTYKSAGDYVITITGTFDYLGQYGYANSSEATATLRLLTNIEIYSKEE